MIWEVNSDPLTIDLNKFSDSHGSSALADAVHNLKECQSILLRLRELDAATNLPPEKNDEINSYTTRLRQLLDSLNRYDQNNPDRTLGASPPNFQSRVRSFHKQLYSSLHSDIAYLTSKRVEDVKSYNTYIENLKTQASDMEAKFKELEKNSLSRLAAIQQEASDRVERQGDKEIAKIVNVDTTQEWSQEYRQYIYQDRYVALKRQDYHESKNKRWKKAKGFWGFWEKVWITAKYGVLSLWNSYFRGGLLYFGQSYASAVRKWSLWRGFYLLLLFILAAIYIFHLIFIGLPSRGEWFDYLVGKLAFVPLVVVLSLGFNFASKNYRINSNLLEEYKHRYVVAKTLQNIFLLPDIKNQASLSAQLWEKGTNILFEHRKSGHITKSSLEERLLKDLVSTLTIDNKK